MTEVSSKPRRFIISQTGDTGAMSLTDLEDTLNTLPGITVIQTVQPAGVSQLSGGPSNSAGLVVASMPQVTAQTLALQAPHLRISPDYPLTLGEPNPKSPSFVLNPSSVIPFSASTTYRLSVLDDQGKGVAQAKVLLMGSTHPISGTTANDGSVTITWESQSVPEPAALYVAPRTDYWERWVDDPTLDPSGVTTVTLTPLSSTLPNLGSEETLGWGQKSMGLDKLPESLKGAGIKIAVIDSGADTTHPDLTHITKGSDLREVPPSANWTKDPIAHGSHCAGVITGFTGNSGIRGFAPAAETHILGVLPGGYFISLIEAVKYCINNGIDVINMSLGGEDESPDFLDILSDARQNGIACIVSAGNTGRNVLFPATSPDVLTVGAIGQFGTYPDFTYHARQVGTPARASSDGNQYFSAKFSCRGPKVDVCAPGVAVLSSVPGNGYAFKDGTSMAAPHVAGMAALIFAHHPDFKGAYRARNAQRVDRCFQIIVESCLPIDVGDSGLTGWGMPNIERALSISPLSVLNSDAPNWASTSTMASGPQTGVTNNTEDNQYTLHDILAAFKLMGRLGALHGGSFGH
jgi:subtilisin family serine protease